MHPSRRPWRTLVRMHDVFPEEGLLSRSCRPHGILTWRSDCVLPTFPTICYRALLRVPACTPKLTSPRQASKNYTLTNGSPNRDGVMLRDELAILDVGMGTLVQSTSADETGCAGRAMACAGAPTRPLPCPRTQGSSATAFHYLSPESSLRCLLVTCICRR